MARSTSANFLTELQSATTHLCELIQVDLRNGETFRFAMLDKDITWDSQTWTALPLSRDDLQSTIDSQSDRTRFQLANITGALRAYVDDERIDGAYITHYRVAYENATAAGDRLILTKGHVDNIQYDNINLSMDLASELSPLNILVPRRIVKSSCNYRLFDDNCAVTKSSYKTSSTTDGAGDEWRVSDSTLTTPVGDDLYYSGGEIEITSGDASGERKTVIHFTSGIIYVASPFSVAIASGVTYDIYPGCDYSVATCESRFSNQTLFSGLGIHVPSMRETRAIDVNKSLE